MFTFKPSVMRSKYKQSLVEFTVRVITGLERRLIKKFAFTVKSFKSIYSKDLESSLQHHSLFELSSTYEYLDISTDLLRVVGHSSRNLIQVEDVLVDLYYGNVFTESGELISESTIWPKSYLTSLAVPVPIGARHLESESFGDVYLASNSFYHFLIEDLPDLLRLKQMTPNFRVIVWERAPKYVVQAITFAEVEYSKAPRFISLDSLKLIEKSKTVAPSRSTISTLRKFMEKSGTLTPCAQNVYISRVGEERSPSFEPELIQLLEFSGVWTILKMGELTFQEQLNYAKSAKIWAGVHGAGLSWIPMLHPKALVIEIGPAKIDCFQQLAYLSGITFFRVEGERGGNSSANQVYEEIESILQNYNLTN